MPGAAFVSEGQQQPRAVLQADSTGRQDGWRPLGAHREGLHATPPSHRLAQQSERVGGNVGIKSQGEAQAAFAASALKFAIFLSRAGFGVRIALGEFSF